MWASFVNEEKIGYPTLLSVCGLLGRDLVDAAVPHVHGAFRSFWTWDSKGQREELWNSGEAPLLPWMCDLGQATYLLQFTIPYL